MQLCMRTPPTLPTQKEEDIFIMELISNTGKFTQNELSCINHYWMWAMV